MPRKVVVSAIIIVALHVTGILTLRGSVSGSLLGNFLQIVASVLAAAMCWSASRRARGFGRPFWMLAACGMATWTAANLGWTYYEIGLLQEPPQLSLVRVLFDVQGVFFAIALFLDEDRDSTQFDLETILDAIQIGIVFVTVFFGLYFVQLMSGATTESGSLLLTWIFAAINMSLTVLAGIKMWRASTARARSLYGGLGLFLLIYAVCSAVADYMQAVYHTPTGMWYDLGWTLPFLMAAYWAASWKEPEEASASRQVRRKTLTSFALKNLALALAPLLVIVLVFPLGREWRLISYSLLSISILCYATRLGLSEFRKSQTADAVLRQSLAMDLSVDGMAILSAEGEHTYVNAAFARMMGRSGPEEFIGKSWREVYDARDMRSLESEVRESLLRGGKWYGSITMHRSDGHAYPIEMGVTLLPDGGTVCVSRDTTDRREAEKARVEAEIKFRTLIEQVAAISYIAELGVDGQWLYVSPQVETILGYTPDEWLTDSRAWLRHIPEEDHPVIKAAEEASKRGEPFQAEYRLRRKDGKIIWVSDTAVVVRGSDSHPVMEGLLVDITEKKQLENQLHLSRRMEAVGRLAGGIAHDFNNLLTIIKGYAELALNRPAIPAALAADVNQIGNAADRATALIRQLLAFSRKQVLQPKRLDLNAIVESLESLLGRLMGADIEMVTRRGKKIGTVKADPAQVEQVIMNLVVNARDAMPNGGRLTIETANVDLDASYARDHATVKPGRYVMLAVSDTGVGMDAETQAHIFEPFYSTKESGRGTGLGLSTVYGIVKQSGGYIWVYSERGHGSTFKVYLPLVEEPVETGAERADMLATRGGSETILLVEDEEGVRDLTRTILDAEGYTVLVADNVAHAEELAAANKGEIHLLFTDMVMPGMSGRDLAQRITRRHPRMRVLFMSGYTDNVITQGGVLEAGVAFLQKPFTPRLVAQKVREVLDAPVPAR
jgi:PAS domain S-box-containing protein